MLKNKFRDELAGQAEELEHASEPDCADCPDYDDCINPWICIATVEKSGV